jgi:ethanolamine utilization protein EutN
MLQAVVVGNVWSTKRIDGLPSGALIEVESGKGERVLITQGSVAAGWLPGRPPVDALIIGSIDEPAARPASKPAPAKRSPRRSAS